LVFPEGEIRQVDTAYDDFSSLVFDDQTAFTFCGDPTTLDPRAYCEILNLRTWYISYSDLFTPFYPAGDIYRNKPLYVNFMANRSI